MSVLLLNLFSDEGAPTTVHFLEMKTVQRALLQTGHLFVCFYHFSALKVHFTVC